MKKKVLTLVSLAVIGFFTVYWNVAKAQMSLVDENAELLAEDVVQFPCTKCIPCVCEFKASTLDGDTGTARVEGFVFKSASKKEKPCRN